MQPTNLLFILSDQHARDAAGCYGHPLAQTPHLDALAERGTRFTRAVTPSPVCVPARAALATGRYVHQTGYWNNAMPYEGRVPSWHHRLRAQGHRVDAIGKLHFRSSENDNGFSREIETMHVADGVGDILTCLREEPVFRKNRNVVDGAGWGDSSYLRYDNRIADHACDWLAAHAHDEDPWCLFVSFVCPHPPYVAPKELFDLYPLDQVPMPPQWHPDEWPDHPALNYLRRFFDWERPFDEETIRTLIAAYYGLCTHLDRQIGRVLDALEANELAENTRIIYTSDHGESVGARGAFGKLTMYEEVVTVPLVVAGPDVPRGRVVETPVSLIDCFPTVLEAVGVSPAAEDADLPGRSLWQSIQTPEPDRTVFSEYHGGASRHAIYMLRDRRYKYVHYTYEQPHLFDLETDPQELRNLAALPEHRSTVEAFEAKLRERLDPEAVDRRAKADQRAVIESFGGAEAARRRGGFDNSPVPGESAAYRTYP